MESLGERKMKDWEIEIAKDMIHFHMKEAPFCERWVIWVIEYLASLIEEEVKEK